jgi:hypothetical protein
MTSLRITLSGAPIAVVAMLVALAGCATDPAPTATPTPSDASAPSAPPPDPAPGRAENLAFSLPDDCAALLPASRLAEFDALELELLGGPDSVYGDRFFAEPTPEEDAGGVSCVWGVDDEPSTLVIVSAAPLDDDTRDDVIGSLLAQDLVESELDGVATFSRVGDTTSTSAIINLLRDDSWISVIEALGGADSFERAVLTAEEVASEVYRAD